MGPKKKDKKGKKGKKGKKEKEKPPKILKSEYVAKIAERNAVLAAARRRTQKIEDLNYKAQKTYEQTQEDMADIMKYLQHEIQANELEIAAYDEQIAAYTAEIERNDKYYESIISNMNAEHEAKEKAMLNQIEQCMPKLSAFDEVSKQRNEYLRKKEQLYQKMRDLEARHQQEVYEAEKEAIIKQDTMQKEMEANLMKLSDALGQASDLAIGETTNKLIRDNISLGNMLTCTQEVFEIARASYRKVYEVEKRYKYNAELLDDEIFMISEKYSDQVSTIETLLRNNEELQEKIKMSEKLFKDNRRLLRQIAEKECILKEKSAELKDELMTLKASNDEFNSMKDYFHWLRRTVVHLEMSLYEVAKKVKQAIDIEMILHLPEESIENVLEADKDEKEAEESLKDFKYKKREKAIEEIIERLSAGLNSGTNRLSGEPSDPQLPAQDSSLSANGRAKTSDQVFK